MNPLIRIAALGAISLLPAAAFASPSLGEIFGFTPERIATFAIATLFALVVFFTVQAFLFRKLFSKFVDSSVTIPTFKLASVLAIGPFVFVFPVIFFAHAAGILPLLSNAVMAIGSAMVTAWFARRLIPQSSEISHVYLKVLGLTVGTSLATYVIFYVVLVMLPLLVLLAIR